MRFSIRRLLALTLLIALVMFARMNERTAAREAAIWNARQAELSNLKAVLNRQATDSEQRDKFRTIALMRDLAMERFANIRERYSVVDPVGPGVLAMRSLPELNIDGEHAPASFRLLVPSERPIWLRCAVLAKEDEYKRPSIDDTPVALDSAFSPAEPFALQLSPGDRTLRIFNRPLEGNRIPVVIEIDGKPVLNTTYQFKNRGHSNLSMMQARSQFNIGPDQQLPGVMTIRMSHLDSDGSDTGEGPYVFSIWLSEQP